MIFDRVHPVETRHTVDVVHQIDHDAEAVAQFRMLKQLDVPRAKLGRRFLASPGLVRYERLLEHRGRQAAGAAADRRTATELKDAP